MSANCNIARFLPRMAHERPDQIAVVTGVGRDRGGVRYEQLTFAELDLLSGRYAWGLTQYGIGRGARVLLMVRPGLPLIALTFALFKAGCIPILIDPAMGRRNLATCIAECKPDALIGVPRAHIARLIFKQAFRTVRHNVTVGNRWGWDGVTLDEVTSGRHDSFAVAPMEKRDLAAILFTTGSTGVPKGVLYEHGMFNAQVDALRELYGLEPGEIEMPAFPLFALFNVALGVTSAIPPLDPTRPAACDPAEIVRFMRDQRVTSTFGSPAIWDKVTRYACDHNVRFPSLRRVLMAGAPVPLAIHERFRDLLPPGADTHTPYGATEALPVSSISGRDVLAAHAERNDPIAGTCIGWPVPNVTLRIMPIIDEPVETWDERMALPTGDIGEIVVCGPTVTHAYVDRPHSTQLAKMRDGNAIWHRMGDLGYLDDRGRLWFYGRKTQRVQLADRCLYTEPCELVFNQHSDMHRSALVGVTHNGAPAAAIVVQPHAAMFPRTAADRDRFVAQLRALGSQHAMTAPIGFFLFHRSFPVDIRHNAKIFREKLAVWAQRQLDKGRQTA